ncbi:MAG: hypothetical protein HQL56_18750 [Magnetococcales bacterium]|nr:hypothetical protein [Magnetococcales bacterium]
MVWIEARKRFRLSHAHIQMARELGLNPKKFGGLDNSHQEPWKLPLPQFIEKIYFKHFKKIKPDQVISLEEVAAARRDKKIAKQAGRALSDTLPIDSQSSTEEAQSK